MRSLSPIAPTPSSAVSRPLPDNSQSLTPGDRGVTRNSSYTLSDYDSYWADSNEKPGQDSKIEAEFMSSNSSQLSNHFLASWCLPNPSLPLNQSHPSQIHGVDSLGRLVSIPHQRFCLSSRPLVLSTTKLLAQFLLHL
ncbi:hypothetical protein LB505_007749 [Fusarium chuoi]|nr:hypothetical protein LB505_007749 [Fusarium chuoi]